MGTIKVLESKKSKSISNSFSEFQPSQALSAKVYLSSNVSVLWYISDFETEARFFHVFYNFKNQVGPLQSCFICVDVVQ